MSCSREHFVGNVGTARLLAWALLVLAALSTAAFAQFETGSISGTVKDSTGAVVAAAEVTVTSHSNGASRKATTDNGGTYNITNLEPGLYELKVSQSGFGDTKQDFTISPGVRSTLDATLSAKGNETVVEVVGQSETQVDTQTSSLTETVNEQQVSQLPSLTRDPYDFVQLMGNVNQDSSSGTGGTDQIKRGAGVSIDGQRSASTDALLDGAENVDLFTTAIGQSVPLDAVQEFSLTSSNFSAEYGRASGGVLNVVTKSGSNAFHGSLYEFNRLSALTSEDVQDVALKNPKQKYTRNQFGYSFGGPVVKNRLFFFSSTEWTRVRSDATTITAIPAPEFLAASNPATQALFAQFPLRSGLRVNQVVTGAQLPPDAGSPTYAAYAATGAPVFDIVSYSTPNDSGGGAPQNTYNMIHRVDFNLNDKTTMYGRYALFSQNEFAGFVNNSPYAGYDTGQNTHNQNVLLSVTHIFSPNVVGDTKLNFNRLSNVQPLSAQQPVQPSLYFNFNFDATVLGQTTCLPGYTCTAPGASLPFGGPQNVGEIAQSLNWNKGQHGFIFGGEYIYTQDNRAFGAYQNAVEAVTPRGGGTVPDGLENLLNGNAGWFQVAINPQGKFPCQKDATGAYIQTPACTVNLPTSQPDFSRSNRFNDMAFFGQDNWKIRPRLTLNLGLRWEYYGVQHNVDPKLDSNFVLGSGGSLQNRIRNGQVYPVSSTAGVPSSPVGGLWHKNLHNFAPRIGFAYDVFGDGKTSLRGGYGIAYERNFGNVTFNVIQNPPAQFNAIFQSPAQPIYSNNLGPFAGTGTFRLPNASLRYVRQDIPTSYSQNWNLSIERELMRNTLLALDYTGAHTIHQYSLENMNQQTWGVIYEGTDPFVDNPRDRLNRQYSNMNTRGFGGFSYYEALNTRFASANLFNQGLTFTVNYTWSHTIDNLSSTFSSSGGESPQTISLGLLDPFQPALDKGNADFDVRHRVAMSAVWALPYAKETHGFARQVLDGWEVAPILIARTGYPFSVFDSTASFGDTVFARYVIPQGTSIPLTGSTATNAGNFLAPDQFAYMRLPASATYFNPLLASAGVIDGEVPTCNTTINSLGDPVSTGQNCQWPANMTRRNAFRGPGVYNINLAVSKTFPITERFRLQFRGEAYNLLNHSNYYIQSAPNQDAGASGCSATLNPGACSSFPIVGAQGVIPIGGVPNERRFIQFALKLLF